MPSMSVVTSRNALCPVLDWDVAAWCESAATPPSSPTIKFACAWLCNVANASRVVLIWAWACKGAETTKGGADGNRHE